MYSNLSSAQEIWARTYSGEKDAIVHSTTDLTNLDVYAIGSSGYGGNPVISAEEANLSSHFVNTATGVGTFVTRYDSNGNTIWYSLLNTDRGVTSNAKVLLSSNNKVVALANKTFYVLKKATGEIEYTFNYDYATYYDFELR